MVIEKKLAEDDINQVVATSGFKKELIVKDYYITVLLYLMKDLKGIYFKGGTALQKTVLDYARLSEDIDFTLTKPLKDVRKEIEKVINDSKMFGIVTQDKDVDQFVRLVVPYKTILGVGEIFIDLNERGKLLLKSELFDMKHFYPNIPKFSFPCLNLKEMTAEKVAAAIGRNKPRDHYDIYKLIKQGIKFDMGLVKQKCLQGSVEFNIVKMFNKAKTLHNRWDKDMIPLLAEEVSFQEVIKTLAEYFNLKEEKEQSK